MIWPRLPEWGDLPCVSERANALMRKNWELINLASDLLAEGGVAPEILVDIWNETLSIERKYEAERAADFYRRWR